MRFKCRRCGATADDATTITRHVTRDHDCRNFGWEVERVPEAAFERPAAWVSNAPLRLRSAVSRGR